MADIPNQSLEAMTADAEVKHWLAEQQLYEKQAREWIERAKRYSLRYRNDQEQADKARRFSIFWSNTEILEAATFGQTPQPDVSRRWNNADDPEMQQVAQQTAILLEKVLRYNADQTDQFEVPIGQANFDALVPGRGTARVATERDFQPMDDGSEQPSDQRAPLSYVYWQDFSHSPARVWKDVTWIRYRHLMTRDDMRNHRATEKVWNEIPLTVTIGARNDLMIEDVRQKSDPPGTFSRAEVWEYWDRQRERIIWLARGHEKILLKEEPIVKFDGFWDCPPPLIYGRTNDTMVPLPEYGRYEALAIELDTITERLAGLASMAKACGAYDQVMKEFDDIASLSDGMFIPLSQGAGADKAIRDKVFMWPVDMVVVAIRELSLRQEQLKQAIFEIEGISDIIRGSSNPNETLGAQNLKAQFGSFRLQGKQNAMRRFVQKCFQLQGEVAAELYEQDTLQRITGEQVTQPMMELLLSEKMRGYQVDVSLEELVRPDQEQQKQQATEYLGAMMSLLTEAVPAIQAVPQLAPMVGEFIKFANRQFKAGRAMEETIDQTMDALTEQASQPQEPPGPSPDVVAREEAATEREQMKTQAAGQREAVKAVTSIQKAQMDAAKATNGTSQ